MDVGKSRHLWQALDEKAGVGYGARVDPRPCLLAARSEYGYTNQAMLALRGEPEAVSSTELERLAEHAHERAEHEHTQRLIARRERLQRELDWHLAQARHRERQLRRIGRKL